MGNESATVSQPLQLRLRAQTKIVRVNFLSLASRNEYFSQLDRRMTIRSAYVPRLLYYRSLPSHSCSPSTLFPAELYFTESGEPLSQKQSILRLGLCKCVELVTALQELRERYGNFEVALPQIFLRDELGPSVSVWISPQVESCSPAKIQSEQKMCQSILATFANIFPSERCSCSKQKKESILHFEDLVRTVISSHRHLNESQRPSPQPLQTVGEEVEHPQLQTRVQQASPISTLCVSAACHPPQEEDRETKAAMQIKLVPPRKAVPKLDCASIQSHSGNSGNQTERRSIEGKEARVEQDNKNSESVGQLTTARTPRDNYMMRKSNDLTIFPNHYQQKFIKTHELKCREQLSARFQVFKRAMHTLRLESATSRPAPQTSEFRSTPFRKTTWMGCQEEDH